MRETAREAIGMEFSSNLHVVFIDLSSGGGSVGVN
jgi:hypothetical protein